VSKKALIITDGTESTRNIAGLIEGALKGFSVKTSTPESFEGTDILCADVFFIGCEKPSPASFSYLEDMLLHINLASRKCGVFSVNDKSLKYLSGIVKDSEAALGSPLHVVSNPVPQKPLQNWVNKILN